MKKSEELRQQAAMEESDSKAFGLDIKARREERMERFEEEWLPAFKERLGKNIAWNHIKQCYQIFAFSGEIQYYPKADKVFDLPANAWYSRGLTWLIKRFSIKQP